MSTGPHETRIAHLITRNQSTKSTRQILSDTCVFITDDGNTQDGEEGNKRKEGRKVDKSSKNYLVRRQ